MKKTLLLVGAMLVLFGAVLLFASSRGGNGPNVTDRTTREVALACTTDMATEFHIHPILEIFINGEKQLIPSNIGIEPTCMRALHTHTPDGVLHVESPEPRDFTLADFFVIWDKPFNATEIMGYKADATHRVRMTVNGTEVATYENTILHDADKIVIYYEAL